MDSSKYRQSLYTYFQYGRSVVLKLYCSSKSSEELARKAIVIKRIGKVWHGG